MINIDQLRKAAEAMNNGVNRLAIDSVVKICMEAIKAMPIGNHNDQPLPWEPQSNPLVVIEKEIKEKVVETIDDKYKNLTKIENENQRLRAIMDLYFYGR
jgi:hypothetical protein